MRISLESLISDSNSTGFRAEILEKAIYLLNLLTAFQRHPSLSGKLALKGGTALNLFYFDIPRLSIDIDLNYTGSVERDSMLSEREDIEKAIQAVCQREDLFVTKSSSEHAGGKWRFRYTSALGGTGNLELDLNFMFRVPLWLPQEKDSVFIGTYTAKGIPVMNLHEVTAGKLAALFSRRASRDLFDVHWLLNQANLDMDKLRFGFMLYGAMNRRDWRTISQDDLRYEPREVANQLFPVLSSKIRYALKKDWAQKLLEDCRKLVSPLLSFTEQEAEFFDRLLDHGDLKVDLLTFDSEQIARIEQHPLLQWKALNVKSHKQRPNK